jgi:hypothetical protein
VAVPTTVAGEARMAALARQAGAWMGTALAVFA